MSKPGEPMRLSRYLATGGIAARRKAELLITAGRVRVNGEIVTTLGTKVDPDSDAVTVDGEAVVARDFLYVLLNKPKGCITAVTDDRGRPTVMDYLPNVPVPVVPVGRLDFYTEGVLLLTNDGELAARLLAPARGVPKTYHVKVHGQLQATDLARLRRGVRLDDGTMTAPAEVATLPSESKHSWLGITIHEGKHRQIHRMLEALGHRVDKLQRVAFANLSFHELRVGDARELTQQELNELRDMVDLPRGPAARGTWHVRREQTDVRRRERGQSGQSGQSGPGPQASGLGEKTGLRPPAAGTSSKASGLREKPGFGPKTGLRPQTSGLREKTGLRPQTSGFRDRTGLGPKTGPKAGFRGKPGLGPKKPYGRPAKPRTGRAAPPARTARPARPARPDRTFGKRRQRST